MSYSMCDCESCLSIREALYKEQRKHRAKYGKAKLKKETEKVLKVRKND